jgi:hypothetical protein
LTTTPAHAAVTPARVWPALTRRVLLLRACVVTVVRSLWLSTCPQAPHVAKAPARARPVRAAAATGSRYDQTASHLGLASVWRGYCLCQALLSAPRRWNVAALSPPHPSLPPSPSSPPPPPPSLPPPPRVRAEAWPRNRAQSRGFEPPPPLLRPTPRRCAVRLRRRAQARTSAAAHGLRRGRSCRSWPRRIAAKGT